MAIPSKQIGWSDKAKLLWNVAKQFETLTQIAKNIYIPPVEPTTTTSSTSTSTTTSSTSTTSTTTTIPAGNFISTEASNPLLTENNNNLIIE